MAVYNSSADALKIFVDSIIAGSQKAEERKQLIETEKRQMANQVELVKLKTEAELKGKMQIKEQEYAFDKQKQAEELDKFNAMNLPQQLSYLMVKGELDKDAIVGLEAQHRSAGDTQKADMLKNSINLYRETDAQQQKTLAQKEKIEQTTPILVKQMEADTAKTLSSISNAEQEMQIKWGKLDLDSRTLLANVDNNINAINLEYDKLQVKTDIADEDRRVKQDELSLKSFKISEDIKLKQTELTQNYELGIKKLELGIAELEELKRKNTADINNRKDLTDIEKMKVDIANSTLDMNIEKMHNQVHQFTMLYKQKADELAMKNDQVFADIQARIDNNVRDNLSKKEVATLQIEAKKREFVEKHNLEMAKLEENKRQHNEKLEQEERKIADKTAQWKAEIETLKERNKNDRESIRLLREKMERKSNESERDYQQRVKKDEADIKKMEKEIVLREREINNRESQFEKEINLEREKFNALKDKTNKDIEGIDHKIKISNEEFEQRKVEFDKEIGIKKEKLGQEGEQFKAIMEYRYAELNQKIKEHQDNYSVALTKVEQAERKFVEDIRRYDEGFPLSQETARAKIELINAQIGKIENDIELGNEERGVKLAKLREDIELTRVTAKLYKARANLADIQIKMGDIRVKLMEAEVGADAEGAKLSTGAIGDTILEMKTKMREFKTSIEEANSMTTNQLTFKNSMLKDLEKTSKEISDIFEDATKKAQKHRALLTTAKNISYYVDGVEKVITGMGTKITNKAISPDDVAEMIAFNSNFEYLTGVGSDGKRPIDKNNRWFGRENLVETKLRGIKDHYDKAMPSILGSLRGIPEEVRKILDDPNHAVNRLTQEIDMIKAEKNQAMQSLTGLITQLEKAHDQANNNLDALIAKRKLIMGGSW